MDVFFNPACGTCRSLKGILEERGVDANYVAYLQDAPSREDLVKVMGMLGIGHPREMMRPHEPVWAELGLDNAGPDELLDAMATHPVLIQRPIVIVGDRAVIARPAERVLELLGR